MYLLLLSRTARYLPFVVAVVMLLSTINCAADPFTTMHRTTAAFVGTTSTTTTTTIPSASHPEYCRTSTVVHLLLAQSLRGGASLEENDDEEEENDVEDDDDDEDDDEEDNADIAASVPAKKIKVAKEKKDKEVEPDIKMVAATLKSAVKTKAKQNSIKVQTSKKAINTKLAKDSESLKSSKKMKKISLFKRLHLPYLLRAILNPFTIFAMTKAYWLSLFDLNYITKRQRQAQGLRSAVEEAAKRHGSSSSPPSNKGRRKMKNGQAKTLSDLPQLSSCG